MELIKNKSVYLHTLIFYPYFFCKYISIFYIAIVEVSEKRKEILL